MNELSHEVDQIASYQCGVETEEWIVFEKFNQLSCNYSKYNAKYNCP